MLYKITFMIKITCHVLNDSRGTYYWYHQNTKKLWCHPIIIFSNIVTAIMGTSWLLLVKLLLLIFFASFTVSVLCLFSWLLSIWLSLLKALAKKILLLFAYAFKSLKERQLFGGQYRKEANNQSAKPIQKIKQRC
jgi:uncharacterized membrane protein YGL010W